jgi:hypothetical protein
MHDGPNSYRRVSSELAQPAETPFPPPRTSQAPSVPILSDPPPSDMTTTSAFVRLREMERSFPRVAPELYRGLRARLSIVESVTETERLLRRRGLL